MGRVLILMPFRTSFLPFYLIMGVLVFLTATGYFATLFSQYGVPYAIAGFLAFNVSLLSLALSPVNVVVKERVRKVAVPEVDVVYVLGIPYYIPRIRVMEDKSVTAVNLGGAVIPVLISLALLGVLTSRLAEFLIVLAGTTLVSYVSAKPVRGVGIVMSPLIPPLASLVASLVLFAGHYDLIPAVAYAASVLGSLIGADLLHLRELEETNPPVLSIGGAGTFDGIFMSGLLSLFLTYFLMLFL